MNEQLKIIVTIDYKGNVVIPQKLLDMVGITDTAGIGVTSTAIMLSGEYSDPRKLFNNRTLNIPRIILKKLKINLNDKLVVFVENEYIVIKRLLLRRKKTLTDK